MSQSANLLKSTFIYTIGNLGSRAFAFVLVPFYSVYLSKSELGIYDLIITSASLLTPLITFQVGDAVYRWLLDANKEIGKAASAFTNGLFVLVIAGLVFGFLCIIFSLVFEFNYLFYTVLYVLFNILTIYLQQVSRGFGKNKLYSAAGILNTFLMVAFTVLFFLLMKPGVDGILLAGIVANFITSVTIFIAGKLGLYIDLKKINGTAVRSMIRYSWPLVPNAIGWWLINEINRFIILFFMGIEANGIFAISIRFPSLLVMVNSVFMLSWQDLAIASNGRSNENSISYSKIFNAYMVLELTMVIALISISKYIVQFIIDPEFFQSWQYMPLLYLSVAFASFSSFLGAAYLNAKKTKSIFFTTLTGSLVNLVTCLLLIRSIGLFAPAAGTLAGYCTMWVIRLHETRKFFRINVNFRLFIFLLLVSFIAMKLVFIENLYADIGVILFAFLLLIVLNMPLAKFIWKQLFHNYLTGLKSKGSL